MRRTIPTFVGLLLVIPQPALAAGPSWSQDGSAEAATLRNDAHAQAATPGAATAGTRGVVYAKEESGDAAMAVIAGDQPSAPAVVDTPPPPAVVGPSIDPLALQKRYELERIAKRGRSYFIPGVVLSTIGTIFVIGSIAGLAKEANGVTIGLTIGSTAVAAIGWPLLVIGVKMRKHPERYLGRSKVQAAIAPTGLTMRF